MDTSLVASESKTMDDNAKKIEYKNIIKEKVLKPSKLPKFQDIRGHHSHLVIRDSHYLIKMPTSFITCSSCHRGRVLKISSIKESSTEEILSEIYSSIGKSPCSKRKQTSKESQEVFQKNYTETVKKIRRDSIIDNSNNPNSSSTIVSSINLENQNPPQPNAFFSVIPTMSHPSITNDNTSNSLIGSSSSQQTSQIQLNPIPIHLGTPGSNLPKTQVIPGATPINSLNHHLSGMNPSPSHYQPNNGSPIGGSPLHHQQAPTQLHHSQLSQQPNVLKRCHIPTMDDFFNDFEDTQEIPNINEDFDIKSIGSSTKITSHTLSSLFNGISVFPTSLDLFLSLGIETDICDKFFTNDTLIIPLPAYSATKFMKDFNKNHFLTDELLTNTINKRIQDFINQPKANLQQLKIVIVFNYFQEGVPDRPHENQSHKYVGNVYVLTRFNVLQDSSLTFTNSRYSFNHNHTWVDPKEEWVKVELFNDMIIKPLQSEIFMKYHQDVLGNHIHASVLERGSAVGLVPYTVDETYLVTSSSSLYVINFITLKILRVLCGADGLQMISYLLSVKVNHRHNLHLLKIILDRLKEFFDS